MDQKIYHQHVKVYKRRNPNRILFECEDCHVTYSKIGEEEVASIGLMNFWITRDDLVFDSYMTEHSFDINPFEHDTLPPSINLKIPYRKALR